MFVIVIIIVGIGSETIGIVVFDLKYMKVKIGNVIDLNYLYNIDILKIEVLFFL